MEFSFPKTFFVTGTDTDVGKTVISAILMLGLQAHYWKPIQSGTKDGSDSQSIQSWTKLPPTQFEKEAYQLHEPLSPHLAARLEGITIALEKIQMPTITTAQHLIVEGAGGLLVPINKQYLMIDLIKHLGIPALVVSRTALGTINHSLLTIERLRLEKIPILGVVMNGKPNSENAHAIEYYGKVPVLAQVPPLSALNPDTLKQAFAQHFTL